MNIPIDKYFNKIYIITSLFASKEHKNNVQELLNICKNVQIINTLNCNCVTEDFIPLLQKHFTNGDSNSLKNFLVNTLSYELAHYNCVLDAYQNNYQRILVLEDDSKININIWNNNDFIIPENIDIIKLYPIKSFDDQANNIKINDSFLIDNDWLSSRSSAYILNSLNSINVLKHIHETEFNMCDLPFFYLSQKCKEYNLSFCYCSKPFIIDTYKFMEQTNINDNYNYDNENIDYVISYIDFNQKEISDLYKKTIGESLDNKYNYSYIDFLLTLKLILKNLPFINKLYITCKDIQTLPEDVENLIKESNGKIIRINESEFMPDNYITFSSACIEMFIWKIPGLSKYFIYGNDDMIPIRPMNKNMFIVNNQVINNIVKYENDLHCLYDLHCLNNTNLIFQRYKNNDDYMYYYKSTHSLRVLNKNLCEECYNKYKIFIHNSLYQRRFFNNFNIDLYVLYAYKNNYNVNKIIYKFDYTNLYNEDIRKEFLDKLNNLIKDNEYYNLPHIICLNDNINDTNNIENIKNDITDFLQCCLKLNI